MGFLDGAHEDAMEGGLGSSQGALNTMLRSFLDMFSGSPEQESAEKTKGRVGKEILGLKSMKVGDQPQQDPFPLRGEQRQTHVPRMPNCLLGCPGWSVAGKEWGWGSGQTQSRHEYT